MESATFAALRRLEEIEAWAAAAERTMAPLSGKTPPMLRHLFTSWPLVSVQMAEKLTGAHRATVQRNIDWMEERCLIREVTGQGRYRMWRIVETRATEARSIPDRHEDQLAEDLYDGRCQLNSLAPRKWPVLERQMLAAPFQASKASIR